MERRRPWRGCVVRALAVAAGSRRSSSHPTPARSSSASAPSQPTAESQTARVAVAKTPRSLLTDAEAGVHSCVSTVCCAMVWSTSCVATPEAASLMEAPRQFSGPMRYRRFVLLQCLIPSHSGSTSTCVLHRHSRRFRDTRPRRTGPTGLCRCYLDCACAMAFVALAPLSGIGRSSAPSLVETLVLTQTSRASHRLERVGRRLRTVRQ